MTNYYDNTEWVSRMSDNGKWKNTKTLQWVLIGTTVVFFIAVLFYRYKYFSITKISDQKNAANLQGNNPWNIILDSIQSKAPEEKKQEPFSINEDNTIIDDKTFDIE